MAIATAAAAALLALVVVKIDTTIRWLVTAIFLALVLAPAVELIQRIRIRGPGRRGGLAISVDVRRPPSSPSASWSSA